MVASKLNLIFFIILSLQLSVTLSQENKHEINGVSMTLHMTMRKKSEFTKTITVQESLYLPARGFIEYYMKLWVGTPAQELSLMMDTGSDVVWVGCTKNYTCNHCNGFRTVFLRKKSSSDVAVKCTDPKCGVLCENKLRCVESFQKCSQICPHFILTYGSGFATGRLLTDTLTLPLEDGGSREIKKFAIGCSVLSSGAAGIAGFGRGRLSMPSQLASLLGDKFAYCLDYVNNISKITLGNKAVPRDITLTYIPSKPNPVFSHYYLGLEAVSIGGKRLTLPSNLTTFDDQGNGGTVIDSGTAYTQFPDLIYNQIVDAITSKIAYKRAPGVQDNIELELCYNVSGLESIQWPKFVFHFKGGSDMVLPDKNTFMAADMGLLDKNSSDTFCLAMQNGGTPVHGPAVILGNIQQSNFYILHDRKNNSFGFTKLQSCTSLA